MRLVTGNDLKTGEVVYFTAGNGWSKRLADAAAFADEAADDALARAKSQPTLVTGVYLVEADGPGQPSARVRIRESIRASGPTVRLDLGKQAEPGA
ncbi:MAG TPA: DUF2849 domain-containing protein [Caulobacterales bacterium]|nr:DUF2849 domain-containing protein [Caulobacterales bacterium]